MKDRSWVETENNDQLSKRLDWAIREIVLYLNNARQPSKIMVDTLDHCRTRETLSEPLDRTNLGSLINDILAIKLFCGGELAEDAGYSLHSLYRDCLNRYEQNIERNPRAVGGFQTEERAIAVDQEREAQLQRDAEFARRLQEAYQDDQAAIARNQAAARALREELNARAHRQEPVVEEEGIVSRLATFIGQALDVLVAPIRMAMGFIGGVVNYLFTPAEPIAIPAEEQNVEARDRALAVQLQAEFDREAGIQRPGFAAADILRQRHNRDAQQGNGR